MKKLRKKKIARFVRSCVSFAHGAAIATAEVGEMR
jgi:hypothetical protein